MDWIAQHSYPGDTLGNDPYGQRPPDPPSRPERPHIPPSSEPSLDPVVVVGLVLLFVCSPLAPVSVILGLVGLSRTKDGQRRGRPIAWADIGVGTALTVVLGVMLAISLAVNDGATRDADGRIREAGLVSIDRLRVGDCIRDMEIEEELAEDETVTGQARVVPCEEPHRAEVYAVNPIDPTDYVDQGSLDQAALSGCITPFEAYVGAPYDNSSIELYFYSPAVDGWSGLDDTVVCVAAHPAGQRGGIIAG